MNFALSDEQGLLREAARGALSRHKTIEAAREALEDPSVLPDLWPTAVGAGWPGLLIDEQHGGAGLGVFEAMLVAEEGGPGLAPVALPGLVPATAILDAVCAEAWYVAKSLIAAEWVGAVQTCLDTSVEYAKERFTFGRAIGSYQAIKHELTEVLRRLENTRSLLYYAGWSRVSKPDEFPLAASMARASGGKALDFAARPVINVPRGNRA